MKLNFLPILQRAYDAYYGTCEETLDPHVCAVCDDDVVPEHARIRRGAWVHKSAFAPISVDPTSAVIWQAQIDAGLVIILPELRGSFDGGTPKIGTGFGDQKDKYMGSDFKATLNDPVYKDNWAHYRSLAGKTEWHLCYLTETQGHLTGAPVTVAPKNPITENVEDEVTWQSDVTWFEFFTPAPFDAPLSVFACLNF